jgi:glutathione S-transferase
VLEVLGRRSSLNVQKVLWLVGELGIPYRHVNRGGAAGGLDTPEFGRLNPNRLVPVVVDGDSVVWESHAILRYLVAAYGAGSIWPVDPGERSLGDRWTDWALSTFQPDFMAVFWGFYRTPEAKRDMRVVDAAAVRCARHLALVDAHLESREFLAGRAFGFGDVPLGAALYRYFEMGYFEAAGVAPPAIPRVRAWYARLAQRAPYREHVQTSFEELRGRLAF